MKPWLSAQPKILARYGLELAGIALIYGVLAKLGLRLALINPSASPVWPATGFALAMVLLLGLRIWPAVFIGALIANATTAGSLLTSAAIASGNTLEAVVGGYLITRFCGGAGTFDAPANVVKFALISIGPATLTSATVGVTALRLGGFVEPGHFTSVWMTWWMGDFAGALLLTPVIVLWTVTDPASLHRKELANTAAVIAAALVVGLIVFNPLGGVTASRAPLGFLVMLPLVWAGLRRGQRDTATVALLLAGIAIWGAAAVKPSDRSSINDAFMLVSMFVIGAALPSLVLSAEVALRRQAQESLRKSEERFRGIFKHAGTGIAVMDLEGRFQSCNPAYAAMLGYTEDELRDLICADLIHADDRVANNIQQNRLLAGAIPSFEMVSRYFSKEGDLLWGHRHLSLLRDASNKPTNIIALVTDITKLKQHEDQISLLLREVNHRSKNMLTVIQTIARQTVAANPLDFIERFNDRIQSLAASQDLLVKNEWKGVELRELARSQLGHFKDTIDPRIELRGPTLFVSASAAQAIGMALHELATNAGKYGALSGEHGCVEVSWRVEPGKGNEKTFTISWREHGGPPVSAPERTGFGSTVLRRVAKESLDAKIELDYAATGLVWQLQCPAAEVIETRRAA